MDASAAPQAFAVAGPGAVGDGTLALTLGGSSTGIALAFTLGSCGIALAFTLGVCASRAGGPVGDALFGGCGSGLFGLFGSLVVIAGGIAEFLFLSL